MHNISALLQDTLDELVSSKTLPVRIDELLSNLEHLLADICISSNPEAQESKRVFVELQDTVDCNVCSRLLPWLSRAAVRLGDMTNAIRSDADHRANVFPLVHQLMKALSLLQGVSLIHEPSKRHLGRRFALEALIDLLWASRHVPVISPSESSASPPSSPGRLRPDHPASLSSISLTSTTLDTLLCVLVDSSPALRVFEDLNGVHYVVKILKRAGSPREVRMKCLEFIYFYLMDESPSSLDLLVDQSQFANSSFNSSRLSYRPSTPTSHSGRLSVSPTRSASSSSSSDSYTSTTTATSVASLASATYTPKASHSKRPSSSSTPSPVSSPHTRASSPRIITTPPKNKSQLRSLMMLRQEVDNVPQSPKKAQISRLGLSEPKASDILNARLRHSGSDNASPSDSQTESEEGRTPRAHRPTHSRTKSVLRQASGPSSASTPAAERLADAALKHRRTRSHLDAGDFAVSRQSSWSSATTVPESGRVPTKCGQRTMEEKREILGSMLGNVDALVDGVRKAGIWGLV